MGGAHVRGDRQRARSSTARRRSSCAPTRLTRDRLERVRAALAAARSARPQPARDDKVVAAWNGLAITALAEAGAAARRAGRGSTPRSRPPICWSPGTCTAGGLRRVSRDGVAGRPDGVLEDYAYVAEAFLTLYAVTGETAWFELAGSLLADVLARFRDADGQFFDTAADAERTRRATRATSPTARPRPGRPPRPAALLAYAAYTGSAEHRSRRAGGRPALAIADRAPRAAGWGLAVAEALLAGPVEVALVGRGDEALARLRRSCCGHRRDSCSPSAPAPQRDRVVPLLADRPAIGGRPPRTSAVASSATPRRPTRCRPPPVGSGRTLH